MCVCVCVSLCKCVCLFDSPGQLVQHFGAFLHVLCLADPEGPLVLHDVCQHRPAHEHHVFTSWGVLDADLELLQGERGWEGEKGVVNGNFSVCVCVCVCVFVCVCGEY